MVEVEGLVAAMTLTPKSVANLLSDDDVEALKYCFNLANREFHFLRGGGNGDGAAVAEKHMETIGRLLDLQ